MREDVKSAILKSFDMRTRAGEMQFDRGVFDAGLRSEVTSGKHLDALTQTIVADLVERGVKEDSIFTGPGDVELPGYFRATKKWDILVFDSDDLTSAVELKSIYGHMETT